MEAVYGQTITTLQINKEGKVSDVDIIVHGTKEMDSAIINALYKMPAWKPALINGKPVSSGYVLPVQFVYETKKVSLNDDVIAKAFFYQGPRDYKRQDYEKAVFMFKEAINRDEKTAKYYFAAGNCYFKTKKQQMACAYWKMADALDKKIIKKEIKEFCHF